MLVGCRESLGGRKGRGEPVSLIDSSVRWVAVVAVAVRCVAYSL